MPHLENPFDDEALRDSTSAAHADDNDTLAADEFFGKHSDYQAHQEVIGRNGHHRFSGPLGPLPGALALREYIAPQQGRQRKLLPLALGLVGLVVILSCLGLGAVVAVNLLSLQSSLNSPQTTLDDFESALHDGDYQTAYNQLSSRYQQQLGYQTFRSDYSTLDVLHGPIQSYQISNLQVQSDTATATVKLVRGMQANRTVKETQVVQLLLEDGSWKIDHIDTMDSLST
jgi:hypothetical protein